MVMVTRFDPLLVTLSLFVAILSSYVALSLSQNLMQTKGRAQILWLTCGALAMGTGIWSMHFVGMLAFEMPGMTMAYDVPLMALSIVVAIGASALALFIVSRETLAIGSLVSGCVAMAAAIAGMHYIGMYSMRMAAKVIWNPWLVVLSIIVALVASGAAFLSWFRLRNHEGRLKENLLAATFLGFAIAGMHYVGMLAATYVHTDEQGIEASNLLVTDGLATTVVFATLFILSLALIGSLGQRLLSASMARANETLDRSEEKFRHLVDAVKDYAIFIIDVKGHITTWNMGAQRITQYSEKEVIGKHMSLFYPQVDIDNDTAENELRIARQTGHFEGEGQRVRKDGTVYWASIVIAPLIKNDELTGFSKVVRDITDVKEAERRLKNMNAELEKRVRARTRDLSFREMQLRTITNAVPVLIAQVDANERLTFANEAFDRWFQFAAGQALGKTFREVLGGDRYSANQPYIDRALAGEVVSYERSSQSGDRLGILSITFVPEFDEDGKQSGFVIVANDITRHKEIQEELRLAKDAAEVANSTKSAFLANMSHEIRTPLGAVLGFSELLLNNEMSPSERVNSVEVIKRNGKLLSNIINDILDLSKVEAGKLEVERVDIPFNEVMQELGAMLQFEASGKGIELKFTADGGIPNRIHTDPLRLRQILLNIVGNAIKFTRKGSVTVRVRLTSEGSSAPKLEFRVTDSGEGISPDQVGRLFTPFTQADVSTTRKFGGTGLGLVLARKLANALGGDVQLTATQPGHGSTFTVTIDPGQTEQVLFLSSDTPPPNVLTLAKTGSPDLSTLKILLADDSPDNQTLVRNILKIAGAEVDLANNGEEAIAMAMKGDYSLILMDLQMPRMDGYEATRRLREMGYTRPIIALTAHAMKEERQRSLRSGFNDHITKPIDRDALIQTLAQCRRATQ